MFYLTLEWLRRKKLVEKLFQEINSHSGLGTYGLKDVTELLINNVVDTLIITDDTNMHRIEVTCKRCQHVQEDIVERPKSFLEKQNYKTHHAQL